jgi:hypothetical protein
MNEDVEVSGTELATQDPVRRFARSIAKPSVCCAVCRWTRLASLCHRLSVLAHGPPVIEAMTPFGAQPMNRWSMPGSVRR